jgi:hypothetical protein
VPVNEVSGQISAEGDPWGSLGFLNHHVFSFPGVDSGIFSSPNIDSDVLGFLGVASGVFSFLSLDDFDILDL